MAQAVNIKENVTFFELQDLDATSFLHTFAIFVGLLEESLY